MGVCDPPPCSLMRKKAVGKTKQLSASANIKVTYMPRALGIALRDVFNAMMGSCPSNSNALRYGQILNGWVFVADFTRGRVEAYDFLNNGA